MLLPLLRFCRQLVSTKDISAGTFHTDVVTKWVIFKVFSFCSCDRAKSDEVGVSSALLSSSYLPLPGKGILPLLWSLRLPLLRTTAYWWGGNKTKAELGKIDKPD